jgi:fatty acid desaturase
MGKIFDAIDPAFAEPHQRKVTLPLVFISGALAGVFFAMIVRPIMLPVLIVLVIVVPACVLTYYVHERFHQRRMAIHNSEASESAPSPPELVSDKARFPINGSPVAASLERA